MLYPRGSLSVWLAVYLMLVLSLAVYAETAQEVVQAVSERYAAIQDVHGSFSGSRISPPRSKQQLVEIREEIRAAIAEAAAADPELEPADWAQIEQSMIGAINAAFDTERATSVESQFLYIKGPLYRMESLAKVTGGDTSLTSRLVETSDGQQVTVKTTASDGNTTTSTYVPRARYNCPVGWLPTLLQSARQIWVERMEELKGQLCYVLVLADMPLEIVEGLWLPGCGNVTLAKVWIDAEKHVWRRMEEYGRQAITVSSEGTHQRFFADPFAMETLLQVHEAVDYRQYAEEVWLPSKVTGAYYHNYRPVGGTGTTAFRYHAVNRGYTTADIERPLASLGSATVGD